MNSNATFSDMGITGWRSRFLKSLLNRPTLQLVALFVLGGLSTFSYAPFYIWPIYLFAIGFLFIAWQVAPTPRQALKAGLSFALGLFGGGISWVYVSIANFGQVGAIVSGLITFGLILLMAIYWGFGGYLYKKAQLFAIPAFQIPLFVALILAGEWLRSTLFTGFPWLLPGYIVETSWLFEWLPVGGIWFVSVVCLLIAASIANYIIFKQGKRFALLTVIIWIGGAYLNFYPPTYVNENSTHTVTLVQGNVAQDEKWQSKNAAPTLSYYQQATAENFSSELVIWPETAITYLLHQVQPYLKGFADDLEQNHTTLITGVPMYDKDQKRYFNSVWATGNGFGLYQKQKLVPFGEYIPLSNWFGPIFDLFGMPMSQFKPGPSNQPALQAGELSIAPFICYEVVYPEVVRNMVRDSDILLTISNDGWFGHSIGPLQHLQIAQFRAKEAGRYMIRATNTGVSGIINANGQVVDALPQFVRATLTGKVATMTGNTPYVMYGNLGLWLLLAIILGLASLPLQRTKAGSL